MSKQMVEELTFNNNQVVEGHAIETDSRLFLYMFNTTMTEAFNLLNDPENTKKIKAERYGDKVTYTGYKHLCSISEESNGMISSSLKKNG